MVFLHLIMVQMGHYKRKIPGRKKEELKYWGHLFLNIGSMKGKGHSKFRIKTLYNRLNAILAHTNYYAFNPHSKLAEQTGLTYSTMHNIGKGDQSPTLFTALKLLEALEKTLDRKLDIREIFSVSEEYQTATLYCAPYIRYIRLK